MTAETIRNEYYYDESAGIRVCLQKAIATANKRLAHQSDRLGIRTADGNGPIGVGVAVVRGNEMYVATIGPAEAYLIRQARLSTLPDPHRERGLPSGELEPDVWRGEISVGDSLVLISPNLVAKLGVDELKDAMLTLHPQSAMEHLHHRFAAADGSGSDGAIAFEATEVSSTARQRTLVPVRPAEPHAGAPDRSPIPLADNVQAAGVAMSAAAGSARSAAGGAFERVVARLQEFLPRRKPVYRRVTPLASRRETQRRAAVALLAFLVVVGGLGVGVYAFGGQAPQEAISSVTVGQRALDKARANLARVTGPGIDLVVAEPEQALALLTEAKDQLDVAEKAAVAQRVIGPLRAQVVTGLDRLYGVVPVASRALFTFRPAEAADPIDLRAIVRGPDGAPYVLDASSKTVYRIDLKNKKATVVVRAGQRAAGATISTPKLLATGGRDLIVVDSKNVVWRWRASDDRGNGTITRIVVKGATGWGDDIRAVGTFLRKKDQGLYNLYAIDPSEEQILAYSPTADGAGFPVQPSRWLSTARDVEGMASMYIDGDIYVTESGALTRFVSGKSEGWDAGAPGALGKPELLRPAPVYSLVSGPTGCTAAADSRCDRRVGQVYGYDRPNSRIVAIEKVTGAFVGQYRLAGGATGWGDIRAMYVIPGVDQAAPTIVWISRDGVHQALLEAVPDVAAPPATAAPSAGPAGSAAPTKQP